VSLARRSSKRLSILKTAHARSEHKIDSLIEAPAIRRMNRVLRCCELLFCTLQHRWFPTFRVLVLFSSEEKPTLLRVALKTTILFRKQKSPVCTCLGLRVPGQCRCSGPGCHTGREGGRKCRPRALTKLRVSKLLHSVYNSTVTVG
jgi:hypothetical protein